MTRLKTSWEKNTHGRSLFHLSEVLSCVQPTVPKIVKRPKWDVHIWLEGVQTVSAKSSWTESEATQDQTASFEQQEEKNVFSKRVIIIWSSSRHALSIDAISSATFYQMLVDFCFFLGGWGQQVCKMAEESQREHTEHSLKILLFPPPSICSIGSLSLAGIHLEKSVVAILHIYFIFPIGVNFLLCGKASLTWDSLLPRCWV